MKAVIGSQYGDEGKGLTVDYLASLDSDSLVVRSNGGAQAAHTVQTPDGRRHVFHHVGSGTFAGAPTHLSRFMVVNPISFNEEMRDLAALGETPSVSVDSSALVSTPFDMLINQMVETHRGDARHGSCGLGIGETIERGEKGFALFVEDLADLSTKDMIMLRKEWAFQRCEQHGLAIDNPKLKEYMEYLNDARVVEAYLQDVQKFLHTVTIKDDGDLLNGKIIFEAAQGLLLDQKIGTFPYVTRSNTGLKNIAELVDIMDNRHTLEVYYVTRAYQTRHGAGPMPHEADISEMFDAVDPTNVPNDWQGSLRYGYLDREQYSDAIQQDMDSIDPIDLELKGVITCLDQVRDRIPVFLNGKMEILTTDEIGQHFHSDMTSWGPTRDTMQSG